MNMVSSSCYDTVFLFSFKFMEGVKIKTTGESKLNASPVIYSRPLMIHYFTYSCIECICRPQTVLANSRTFLSRQ